MHQHPTPSRVVHECTLRIRNSPYFAGPAENRYSRGEMLKVEPTSLDASCRPAMTHRSCQVAASVICVVDQDAAIRDGLRLLLSTLRLEVETFRNAGAFLRAAEELSVLCLIADMDLPDMNGVKLLEHLDERGLRIPTILMASDSDVTTAVNALKAGAIDFVEKPLIDRLLLQRVRQLLNLPPGN